MKTDTKVIIAGVLVLGLGVWYVQRQVSGAIDGVGRGITDAWNGIGNGLSAGLGAAYDTAAGAGRYVGDVAALAAPSYTDAAGNYTPFGAVPSDTAYYTPWYLGGGMTFPNAGVRQAEQADVRRIDNQIAAGMSPASSWSFLFPNYAS